MRPSSTSPRLLNLALLCYTLLVVKAIPASVQPLSRAKVVASLPSKRQQQQQDLLLLQESSSSKAVASIAINYSDGYPDAAALPEDSQAEAYEVQFVQPDIAPPKSVLEKPQEQVQPMSIRAATPRHSHTMPDLRTWPELRLKNVIAKNDSPFLGGVRDIGQRATMQKIPARALSSTSTNRKAGPSRTNTKLYTDLKRAVEEFALSRYVGAKQADLVAAILDPTSDRIAVPRAIAEMIYSSIEGASIDPYLSDHRGTIFSYPCSTPIDFKFRLSQVSSSTMNERERQTEEAERTFGLNHFRLEPLKDRPNLCIGAVYGWEDLTDIAGDVGTDEQRLSFQSYWRRR
ncbi:BQ2448_1594 [Microbotryum intermedium]|uniref:BQ2448_1594 protein n=1 Tax=Microbotryum intermedium TaxID=269621 RepID=A0A238F8M5_9BASI|nr:BQ2448_1594 [Microbotryum intermedium]